MKRYRKLSGGSGVLAYELVGADAIDVKFADGTVYSYSYASTGRDRVERMKALARAGRGLSTYIAQQVRGAYAARR